MISILFTLFIIKNIVVKEYLFYSLC